MVCFTAIPHTGPLATQSSILRVGIQYKVEPTDVGTGSVGGTYPESKGYKCYSMTRLTIGFLSLKRT